MATLAAMLKAQGHLVQGSDQHVYPPMSEFLEREGIVAHQGYAAAHVGDDVDLVVVGNAVSRGNPELESVLERRLRYCSLPEAVRDEFLWTRRPVVVAGTHGKTTTTALTGWLLTHGGQDPTVLVGGIAANLGQEGASYRLGAGPAFVIEGDEYDSAFFDKTAKFLKYLPDVAIIGNVEFDHADIYADFDAVRLAFRRLVTLVPGNGLLLLGADSPAAAALRPSAVSPVETFGVDEGADWRAVDVEVVEGGTTFAVTRSGDRIGTFRSPLLGVHNVRNALAAIAVGCRAGIPAATLAEGLATFRGIKRRLETVGVARGVTVVDDFAHHPTAVRETLAAVRQAYPSRRIWAVFEPRSASSCRRVFQDDFARAFDAADQVVLAQVYRTSLPESERLSVDELVASLGTRGLQARVLPDVPAIVEALVEGCQPGDLVVVMSNGGFGGIHRLLLGALGA
ncbi:MAG: UDP-N-acetylmuramate:L-alanyl-gamma-D-glutamyl-meso-diaminopimelate ligase [Acidobacteria bacterium]|nr:UDP-N-acetylmuramate:L-alanyl-gamma-D-glutamyl-meso-diaminopimelate ligase [Acidobacteriota bacterium]